MLSVVVACGAKAFDLALLVEQTGSIPLTPQPQEGETGMSGPRFRRLFALRHARCSDSSVGGHKAAQTPDTTTLFPPAENGRMIVSLLCCLSSESAVV